MERCLRQVSLSHSRWVQPKLTWSRKVVGSPKSTSFISTFHIRSMACFFPTSFMSSTYTDKNRPSSRLTKKHSQFGTLSQQCSNRTFSNCLSHDSPARGWPYIFRSRGTTGSSMLDHDFGHLCFGKRIQISRLSDFGIFSNDGHLPFWPVCKLILRPLLVLRIRVALLWHPWLLLPSFVMLMNLATHKNVVKEGCWFAQVDFFHKYFPH